MIYKKQKAFISETAGKISVDEEAVNDLRMGCIIYRRKNLEI